MLKNLVALVTGGTHGLGKGTVQMFLQNGAKVIICDLPDSKGADMAESLGNDVVFVPTDVTAEADVQNALKITKKKFGRLDVVVNCNNILTNERIYDPARYKPQDLSHFTDSLKVNTIGTFNVIRLSVPLIAANTPDEGQQRGVIVNTVHTTAFDGHEGDTLNAASNAAIIGMTMPIARELRSIGIRVVNIAPGVMDTDFYRKKNVNELGFHISMNAFPERLGKPAEFAHMVQTIVENPMLNAETIRLDAGFRAI